MEFMLPIDIKKLSPPVKYGDHIMLVGSCFTEHIGNSLAGLKFNVLQNPSGILFDTNSVSRNIISYIDNKQTGEADLFYLNETWNSWSHHSRYSNPVKQDAISNINESTNNAHQFLKKAQWLIITLGSSFSYQLTGNCNSPGNFELNEGVANCHRAPVQWFNKHMMTIDEIVSSLDIMYHRLKSFNPSLNIIFTVSPVRHIRDGVVENNRSKARLIESVHHIVSKFTGLYYFPAYEIVIDVLRDYRFYDIDLVHPNYMATDFVLRKFIDACIDEKELALMDEIKKIVTAGRHKPFQPGSNAHAQFLRTNLEKAQQLASKYPQIDLTKEISYFSRGASSESL